MNWTLFSLGLAFFLWGLSNVDVYKDEKSRKLFKNILGFFYFLIGLIVIYLSSIAT